MNEQALCFESLKLQCEQMGLKPEEIPVFTDILTQDELEMKSLQYSDILEVVIYFLERFLLSVKGVPILTAVTDAEGYILEMHGDDSIRSTINQLGMRPGVRYTVEDFGVNSVSLAIETKAGVAVVGEDHYHQFFHSSACYSMPIKDESGNRVIGTISLLTGLEFANPLLLTLLSTLNDSIERELKLLNQNNQLNIINRIIMDTNRNGIVISDRNGRLIGFNLFAEQLTQINSADVLGRDIAELNTFGKYLVDVLQEKKQFTDMEITFVRKDGQERFILFDALPILDDRGMIMGAFAQFRDITERKETDKLLLDSEKLAVVGQLAASVAHEIRNPLTTIRGFIQFLEKDFQDQHYQEIIINEIDRINFIISEFLILSKPHALYYQQKNLSHILSEIVELFKPHAIMNNVEVEVKANPEPLLITCDENQLKQVFVNLLKNSMEALPFGGTILVSAFKKGEDKVAIQIKDNGTGMNSEQIQNLGTPFYTTKDTGTGLGLMVVKRILEHHKGEIEINSEIGKGTTVEITLPILYKV